MAQTLRSATADDLAGIARVAALVGQDHEWAGGDERYVRHLLAHGRAVVAEGDGGLVGYAATRTLDGPLGRVSMLCDLFVAPESRGAGLGRAMLAEVWGDEAERMTFSSTHPHALPLYTSFGVSAWWPLLYLVGDPSRVPVPSAFSVTPVAAEEAARLEQDWTRIDRSAEYTAWQARPGGAALVVQEDGEVVAAGTRGGDPAALEHLRIRPATEDVTARAAVCAAAACPTGAVGRCYLPAPHPAVATLLAAGWRVEDHDMFMGTRPDLLDPTRDVPSPGLA